MSTKQWGVTPPLNTRPPSKAETKCNQAYTNLLKADLDLFEAPEAAEKRENILSQLRAYYSPLLLLLGAIVSKWAKDVLIQKVCAIVLSLNLVEGVPEETITDNKACRVVTFGSYHLEVHSSESDIDALCVFPDKILRSDFFEGFFPVLKAVPEVTHLNV